MRHRTLLLAWLLMSAGACLDPERIVVTSQQDASTQGDVPACAVCMSSDENPACRDLVTQCRGAMACREALDCVLGSCAGNDFQTFLACVNGCVKQADLLGAANGSEYGVGLYQCFSATCRLQCIVESDAGAR